jgi:CBS domain containing-hemolysin-like protein
MDGLLQDLLIYWANTLDATLAYFAFDQARLSEPDMIARLTLQGLLLIGSAFFSGSETALFSLSRLDLQKLRRERNRHSETLHALLDQPRRLIISILTGNELVNIAASINMASIIISLYGIDKAPWVTIIIMVPLLLLFGEITPKTIAISNPVRVCTSMVATPMNLWVKLITPLRWLIRGVADRITTLVVGEEKAAENILHVDEFKSLVEEVAKEGSLDATERALIYNLLEAGDTEIVEIMTPRTRTAFLDADLSVPEMIKCFTEYRHPRVPVFRLHKDNMVGFLHAEDILRLVLDDADLSALELDDIMHPPVVVPPTKKVDEMFDFFQNHNARAAVVLNEFGGVEGFLTMKDVLTFIFGQISGEIAGHEHYQERDENIYEIPGDMKLNDFNNLTNFGIEDPRMTTIGGVAFRHLDRLPKEGDTVAMEGIVITVLKMDGHRIAQVKVSRRSVTEEDNISETENSIDTESADSISDINPINANEESAAQDDQSSIVDDDSEPEKSDEEADILDKENQSAHIAPKHSAANDQTMSASSQDDTVAHKDPGGK